MKKITALALALCLLLSLAACKRPAETPETPTETAPNATQSTDPTVSGEPAFSESMVAVSVPTTTENTLHSDGTVLFQYTYQSLSLVLHNPSAADKIILNFLNRIDSTRAPAASVADMAKNAYSSSSDWVPYRYHLVYSPMRIDQRVLSLFGENILFTGTAHPDRTCVSASYDLTTGDVLTLAGIMTPEATSEDFCKLVLDGLTTRAEGDYLYENYAQTVKQRFAADAAQDEAWYFTQTGICFYFNPYEIAPYTLGYIPVEIPYSELTGLVHASYLPDAKQTPQGDIVITPFAEADLTKFTDIAELVEDQDGKMYILHTEGVVRDFRIQTFEGGRYTAFAANILTPTDAVMLQVNDTTKATVIFSYTTDSGVKEKPFV